MYCLHVVGVTITTDLPKQAKRRTVVADTAICSESNVELTVWFARRGGRWVARVAGLFPEIVSRVGTNINTSDNIISADCSVELKHFLETVQFYSQAK